MHFTTEQKAVLHILIQNGEKIKAIRHLRLTYHMPAAQALTLVENLSLEIDAEPDIVASDKKEILNRLPSKSKGANIGEMIGWSFATCG